MPFLANDNLKIMSALRLSVDDLTVINDKMSAVSTNNALVLKIQGLLSEIEELEEQIKTEQTNPNFALIQADVLQWEGGGNRTLGFTLTLYQKILDLGRSLGLPPNLELEESLLNKANIEIGTGKDQVMILGKIRN